LAESQGTSVSELLGFAKVDGMSENEANWWYARNKRVPFLTEQVNLSGAQYTNWLKHDWMNDPEAMKAAHAKAKAQQEKNKKESLKDV